MLFDVTKLKQCGQDVRISDQVCIRSPHLVSVGDHVAIDSFTHITTALELGNYIHIGPHVSIIGGSKTAFIMRDFAAVAAGCRIICASDEVILGTGIAAPFVPARFRNVVRSAPVIMEKHSVLFTNCVVMPGVRLGEGAVAAACSVIKEDLEPWTVYQGDPAVAVCRRRSKHVLELEAELLAETRAERQGQGR